MDGEKAKGLEGEHHLGINGFQETPHWLGFPPPFQESRVNLHRRWISQIEKVLKLGISLWHSGFSACHIFRFGHIEMEFSEKLI